MQNSIWYHKQALIACFAFVLLFSAQGIRAQSLSYPEYTMEGDTIWHNFPPPDSSYFHGRIGIKFAKGALDLSQLCYACDTIIRTRTRPKGAEPQGAIRDPDDIEYFDQCDETLMNQQFGTDIVLDPLIRSILQSNGVSYLQRMTVANPCEDSLNLSHFGDTNAMDDWNMMYVYFNNDTSVVPTIEALFMASYVGNNSVDYAEPDYIMQPAGGSNTPADPYYNNTDTVSGVGPQRSFKMIGMEGADGAWEFEVGDANIVVAVVDQGVDYERCDLGSGWGNKVIGGMDYQGHDIYGNQDSTRKTATGIVWDALHGTEVASIIGAYTNRVGADKPGCFVGGLNGMAGLGGGWGPYPDSSDERGGGVKIVGYNVQVPGNEWSSLNMAAAILDASRNSLYGHYGKGVDVINISGTYADTIGSYKDSTTKYSLFVRNAISVAFIQCGANLVFAKGNLDKDTFNYPSSHEPASEIIAVGGANQNKARWSGSNWGGNVDLIAPAESDNGAPEISLGLEPANGDSLDNESYATDQKDQFAWFTKTSAAAPHVSGVVALVRGYLTNWLLMPFAREDPEGMLKASAFDVSTLSPPLNVDPYGPTTYIPGYNPLTGYGMLRADSIFQMLDPAGAKRYNLWDVELPSDSIHFQKWPTWPDSVLKDVTFFDAVDSSIGPSRTICDAIRREITGTYTYNPALLLPPNLVTNDVHSPVFIWGNTGSAANASPKKRGYASELPNWKEPWCEVTSGVSAGYKSSNNVPGIAGLINSTGKTVTLHTYQYRLYKIGTDSLLYTWPNDTSIGLGFTIFGPTHNSSGVKQDAPENSFQMWPSIATTNEMGTLNGNETAESLTLVNSVGDEVYTRPFVPEVHHFQFSVSVIPSGIYLARVMTRNGERDAKFVVEH